MTTTRGGAERVELFRGQDRLWYFRRVAANNEVVADSEGYQNRADAVATAARLFPDVNVWIQDQGEWRKTMSVSEDELPEKTGAIEDEELLDPQPEPEQPEGATEDGPDPTIGPAEDDAEDEG